MFVPAKEHMRYVLLYEFNKVGKIHSEQNEMIYCMNEVIGSGFHRLRIGDFNLKYRVEQ